MPLRPETSRLWQRLHQESLLAGFVLIGGTALALHIDHRISEDLDFAWLGPIPLPAPRIQRLLRMLRKEKWHIEPISHVAAEQEFLNSGLVLAESQQDYAVNDTVKLSFVRFDQETTQLLEGDAQSPVRLASMAELFRTKALVCREREKTRDWFDLYIFLTQHGYTMRDVYRVYEAAGLERSFDQAGMRLRKCQPHLSDEGYQQLVQRPPSLNHIRGFFNRELDQLERQLAQEKIALSQSK